MKVVDFTDGGETVLDLEKGELRVDPQLVVRAGDSSSSKMTSSVMSEPSKGDNQIDLGSGVKILTVSDNVNGGNDEMVAVPTVMVSGGGNSCDGVGCKKEEVLVVLTSRKAQLSRDSSTHEQCRVCQQDKDEILIDLGCQCRGDLGKAHRSCIDTWFRTKGSNKCEICQQVAVNVPLPQSHPTASYWAWRVDPAYGGGSTLQERPRGGFSPLWVAFSILIGGLLLDILISITFGVSALPVNIIIGVIVVLGLGTALRLAIEFFQNWNVRRVVQRTDPNVHFGYNAAV